MRRPLPVKQCGGRGQGGLSVCVARLSAVERRTGQRVPRKRIAAGVRCGVGGVSGQGVQGKASRPPARIFRYHVQGMLVLVSDGGWANAIGRPCRAVFLMRTHADDLLPLSWLPDSCREAAARSFGRGSWAPTVSSATDRDWPSQPLPIVYRRPSLRSRTAAKSGSCTSTPAAARGSDIILKKGRISL